MHLITLDNVASYLIDKKLMSTMPITESQIRITKASRKNTNMIVHLGGGNKGLFIKQPRPSQLLQQKLKQEAIFYQTQNVNNSISRFLPKYIHYDADNQILVTELLSSFSNLLRIFKNQSPSRFQIFHGLGMILTQLHAMSKEKIGQNFTDIKFPSTLFVDRPSAEIYAQLSPANLQFIKRMQKNAEIQQNFENIRNVWKTDSIIHGDIRWDNIAIIQSGDRLQIKLLDWELAGFGDPAWDVASVFHDLLYVWHSGLAYDKKQRIMPVLNTEQTLNSVQQCARSFWFGYTVRKENRQKFLHRSMLYCAARLIQSAYDSQKFTSAIQRKAVSILQLSYNIFAEPRKATMYLLGIPF